MNARPDDSLKSRPSPAQAAEAALSTTLYQELLANASPSTGLAVERKTQIAYPGISRRVP